MKVYVTKFVETHGIMELEALPTSNPTMVVVDAETAYYDGEWTVDINEAVRMALKEIENSRKYLKQRLIELDVVERKILDISNDYVINGCGSCCS